MLEKHFYVAPLIKNGKPTLQIRRSFSNGREIEEILETIVNQGKLEMKIFVSFRDPLLARIRLKQLGLIK
jgi:hypothetical protein